MGGLTSSPRKQRAARRNGRRGGRPRRSRLAVCRAAFLRRVLRVALRAGWRGDRREGKGRAIEELEYQFGVNRGQAREWLTAFEVLAMLNDRPTDAEGQHDS